MKADSKDRHCEGRRQKAGVMAADAAGQLRDGKKAVFWKYDAKAEGKVQA